MNVTRMIREFGINSRRELEEYGQKSPAAAENYMDLGLTYLPTSVAPALRQLMPVLGGAGKRVRVVSRRSEMTPDLLTRADIVYVGYLSGLGMLRRVVFAGSQFAIGDTYDELIDRKSGHHYVSQSSSLWRGDPSYREAAGISRRSPEPTATGWWSSRARATSRWRTRRRLIARAESMRPPDRAGG